MKTKKLLSVALIALMLLSCIPIFASAATVKLDRNNMKIIPPTYSKNDINFGEALSTVEIIGGTVYYIQPETGDLLEVPGHFEWNNPDLAPTIVGNYSASLKFIPVDTETYGSSVRVLTLLFKNALMEGYTWDRLTIHGTYTEIVTPPAFTCDAGARLTMYPNYTKTGGKVVDADGKDVTSYGQFYIDDTGSGGKNEYLYEDTYVTARWDDIQKAGYESAYYENVLVKVTKVSATLKTAPSIPAVYVGTTIGEAMEQLTATVTLKGTGSYSDTSAKFWEVNYPEGCDANTPITEDMTLSLTYNHPGATNTLSADVAVSTYSRPLAVITELPTASTVGIKPGMKVSALTLTGGKAVLEGSETEVAGTFSFVEPDALLRSDINILKVAFTPDDLSACEPTEGEIKVSITSLIINKPTVEVINFKEGMTAADVVITGGETTEPGTFSVMYPDGQLRVGFNSVEIKFTPSAEGAEYFDTFNAVLNLKYKIRFVDADGNDIIPEITIKSAAVFGSSNIISAYLYDYLNATKITDWQYFDMDGNSLDGTAVPIGKHQYQVKVTSKDTNYEPTMLTFLLTLEPTYFNATTRYDYVNKYLTVIPDNKSISDEFDVWVDGELVGTTTGQKIKWETDESRDYAVTLVHKDTTEGVYALANTEYTMTVKIPRQIFRSDSGLKFTTTGGTYPGNDNYAYKGDVLTLTCTDETFYNWQLSIDGEDWIPEGLTEEDLKKPTITFTMPDCDIFACPNDESRFAAAADCDHLCHSENPIMQMFWKILHFIFRLFNVQQYCDCGMKHYESALFSF
ncbi:MAG: hypothetical protein IKB13_08340 [Clostridia bacterium]|nr:hypothetical protein [Clostridia bacterium]